MQIISVQNFHFCPHFLFLRYLYFCSQFELGPMYIPAISTWNFRLKFPKSQVVISLCIPFCCPIFQNPKFHILHFGIQNPKFNIFALWHSISKIQNLTFFHFGIQFPKSYFLTFWILQA